MPFVDVDGLEAAARRLAAGAAAVERSAARLTRAAAATTWRGRAADAFRAALAEDVARLRATAGELDDAARALRRHADVVRERLAALEDAADAVVDVLGGAADDVLRRLP